MINKWLQLRSFSNSLPRVHLIYRVWSLLFPTSILFINVLHLEYLSKDAFQSIKIIGLSFKNFFHDDVTFCIMLFRHHLAIKEVFLCSIYLSSQLEYKLLENKDYGIWCVCVYVFTGKLTLNICWVFVWFFKNSNSLIWIIQNKNEYFKSCTSCCSI